MPGRACGVDVDMDMDMGWDRGDGMGWDGMRYKYIKNSYRYSLFICSVGQGSLSEKPEREASRRRKKESKERKERKGMQ